MLFGQVGRENVA